MIKSLTLAQIQAIEARIKTVEWFGHDYEEFVLNDRDSFSSDEEQTRHKEEYKLYLEILEENEKSIPL